RGTIRVGLGPIHTINGVPIKTALAPGAELTPFRLVFGLDALPVDCRTGGRADACLHAGTIGSDCHLRLIYAVGRKRHLVYRLRLVQVLVPHPKGPAWDGHLVLRALQARRGGVAWWRRGRF